MIVQSNTKLQKSFSLVNLCNENHVNWCRTPAYEMTPTTEYDWQMCGKKLKFHIQKGGHLKFKFDFYVKYKYLKHT